MSRKKRRAESGERRARRKARRRLSRANLQASNVPASLQIEATAAVELQAAAGENQNTPRTFRGTAYTGGAMRPRGFFRDVVVDLAGTRVAGGMRPVLLDHDPTQIVGHSTEITVNRRVDLAGVVSGAGQAAAEVVAAADNGFPWRLSLGASIEKINFIGEGETAQANGKTWKGPIYVVRAATINEISFVTLAGDDRTSASVAAGKERGDQQMNFNEWLQAKGFDPEQLSDEQRTTLKAAYDAELAAAAGHDDDHDDDDDGNDRNINAGGSTDNASDDHLANMRATAAAEARRQDAISRLCAAHDEPTITVDNQQLPLRAHAIEQNWDRNQVELHILRAARAQGPIPPRGQQPDRTPAALCAALCLSAGLPEQVVARDLSEQDMNAATSARYRQTTIHMVMDQVIQAAGGFFSGNRKSNEFIRAALRAERQLSAGEGYSSLNAASGFSTISLAGILGNVANKALIAAYEAVETVHQLIAAQRNHSDFKVATRYRLDSTGAFQKVGADGELKHVGMAEAGYTNQLATYGAIIALTRQMMINDDLDAFLQIPTLIGRMSAIKREEETFKLLLSNPGSFFHANNANLITDVLNIAGLTVGEQKFTDQVDSNGKPILVSPAILLAGSPLFVVAKELHDETKVETDGSARNFASNPHVGKYTPLKSPYLSNTAITDSAGAAISGQSATQWYLFSDPMVRAAMAVASLNGMRLPTIESDETDFNTLGMQWRGYDDFGVGMEDPVAAVKSTGAG